MTEYENMPRCGQCYSHNNDNLSRPCIIESFKCGIFMNSSRALPAHDIKEIKIQNFERRKIQIEINRMGRRVFPVREGRGVEDPREGEGVGWTVSNFNPFSQNAGNVSLRSELHSCTVHVKTVPSVRCFVRGGRRGFTASNSRAL